MRLNLTTGPERYDLAPGLFIVAAPATTDVMEAAKEDPAFREAVDALGGSLDKPDPSYARRVGIAMAKAIARLVIEDWGGFEDPDGSPAPVAPDRINAALDHHVIYEKFSQVYLARWLVLDLEKNGFAPSPSGTSEGATTTAKPARESAKSARAKSTELKR